MITQDFRPATLNELAGQDLNKKILRSIIKDPTVAPKTLIFQGQMGTGKTSSARIFAKALNCEAKTNQPCGKCPSCLEDMESSSYYYEYDSSMIGNVETIRNLRDTFSYSRSTGYKVIVIDEIQVSSKQSQSALLKVLEEAPSNTFFVMATTDVDKVLPTIRSRSMELRFDLVRQPDIIENLKGITLQKGIAVPDHLLELIAKRSRGHMRNAHMLLDQYYLIGEESFQEAVTSSMDSFIEYLKGLVTGDKERTFRAIDALLSFPLADLISDYQDLVNLLAENMVAYKESPELADIMKALGGNILPVIRLLLSDWILDGFKSDITLRATLLCIFQMLNTKKHQAPQSSYERNARQ